MKRHLLTLIFAAGALLASAQSTPHAIGFHMGGSTLDLEYQYHFNQKNFLDVTAGIFDLDKGFLAQGVYNWNIRQWSETLKYRFKRGGPSVGVLQTKAAACTVRMVTEYYRRSTKKQL